MNRVSKGENERLPMEVVLSTEKSIEAKNSLAQSENKAIQLEIRSDGNHERKTDLAIAATKEVTEKSPDRYSPLYNAEHSTPKETRSRENDTSDSKTSRQDSTPFYQPSDFSNPLPLEAMRQAFDQPQHMILGRNQLSPLQNLRHLEENLNRELHPHVTNGMSYGMIVTQPLFASNMYHPGLDTHPRFHAESPILGGYSMSHPYGGVSLINTPHPMSLMLNHLPVHRYPLINNTPKSPTSDSAHLGSLRSPSHNPQQEFNLHRNPEYNPVQTNLPERHVHQMPEYERHPSTFPGDRLLSTSGLRHGGSSEQDHHHFRNLQPEHTVSPQHQPREINHEDRHLYYTPIRENDQRSLHKPLDPSDDSHKPREYSPLEKPPIYPPRDYNPLNHMNSNAHNQLPSRLHHPTSSPSLRQLPSYSVVPQELLPKYLQNPTYNSHHHHTRHQLPEDAKLPQHLQSHHHYGPLTENRGPVHQSRVNPALHPGSLRPGVTMEDSLSAIHRQRLGHPDPVHRYHRDHDDLKAKLDEKQSKNYRINDLEDSSLPYSKELKKYRKASLKQSEDDLDSHPSHKYVIKIG